MYMNDKFEYLPNVLTSNIKADIVLWGQYRLLIIKFIYLTDVLTSCLSADIAKSRNYRLLSATLKLYSILSFS